MSWSQRREPERTPCLILLFSTDYIAFMLGPRQAKRRVIWTEVPSEALPSSESMPAAVRNTLHFDWEPGAQQQTSSAFLSHPVCGTVWFAEHATKFSVATLRVEQELLNSGRPTDPGARGLRDTFSVVV